MLIKLPGRCKLVSIGFFISIVSSLFGQSLTTNKCDKKDAAYCFNCKDDFETMFMYAKSLAISAYPELNGATIRYKQTKIKTIMAARPSIRTLFNKKGKREYTIVLSNNPKNKCDSIFCQIPTLALIGILGHEYAHLLSYNEKSSVQLIFFAFKYLISKKEIERKTDTIAIERGFGDELIEFNHFVQNSNLVSKEYILRRQNYYLSVNEIETLNQR